MGLLANGVMPNHFRLALWPVDDLKGGDES
jgi:hypothetical protein